MAQKQKNRLGFSLMNLSANWLNQLVVILFRFVNRAVFVRVLSKEYLGLSGLFSDVLMLLSLAELGVGAAISYHLYKPLADNNQAAVCRLMNLFRRIYVGIGVFVFLAGAALTPFLPFLIKEMPDIPHLSLIYLLFVADSAASYFFAYKSLLLTADQHSYLVTAVGIITNILTTIAQVALLLTTGSYIGYLLLKIAMTLANNLLVSVITDRRYPYLRQNRREQPEKAEIKEIIRYTRAMMLHKVGSVAVNSTDNVIISKFVGLAVGGAYSNYVLLSTCLNKIVGEVFNAVGASIGSMGVTEPLDRQKKIFDRLFLLDFWGYSFAACGLVCVATPLVSICFGAQYEMAAAVPTLLAISFYFTGMRKTVQTFNSSLGLLRHNRYAPLFEAAINLIVSIVLAQKIGLPGVIIGTIVSTLLVPIWIEPLVLYRFHFRQNAAGYLLRLIGLTVLAAAECVLCWKLCSLVQVNLFIEVLYRIAVCVVICNGIHVIVFHHTDAMHFYVDLLKRLTKCLKKDKYGAVYEDIPGSNSDEED